MEVRTTGRTVYCHFSFRRPKGENYGIFAAAVYYDFEGKKLAAKRVEKQELWENKQFTTAIQSYEYVLMCISDWQAQMRKAGISQVMLVTDNSILAGWILDPYKNRDYTDYMLRAIKLYKTGGAKEIVIGVGLCKPRKAEKSYKYCKEEYINHESTSHVVSNPRATYTLKVDGIKSALDIIQEDISIPKVEGIDEVEI